MSDRFSPYLRVKSDRLLATDTFAQTSAPSLPRQIAPHLYRAERFSDMPGAVVVPAGQPPEYSLDRLATWRCMPDDDAYRLATCAKYYLSGEPLKITALTLKKGSYSNQDEKLLEATLADGRRMDVWLSPLYRTSLPDGSIVQGGLIEYELLKDMRVPWGPEPLINLKFNNLLSPSGLSYLKRTAPDGRVLWAYVYLIQTEGYTTDKWDNEMTRDPLVGTNEEYFPKGASSAFLSSSITRREHFGFGAFDFEIDLSTGQPLIMHPRIRAVPVPEIVQHYHRALNELIAEGVVNESNTRVMQGDHPPALVRFLGRGHLVSERLQQNLLQSYFTNTTQGTQK